MASYTLYPPIVDGSMPAFIAGKDSYCRVYFSLSKFNSSIDFKNAHVSIVKQSTGEKVVNPVDGDGMYRAAGIIIDMPVIAESIENNIYYVDIANSNLNTSSEKYTGWVPGISYKIQLRLSTVSYKDDNDQNYGQATWLNAYASEFSEWSTVCVVKPTCKPKITFTSIQDGVIKGNDLVGTYINEDVTEPLYNYQVSLYNSSNQLLNQSEWIIAPKNLNQSSIKYVFKYDLKVGDYIVKFDYYTLNGYHEVLTLPCSFVLDVQRTSAVILSTIENPHDFLIETNYKNIFSLTNLYDEEEEGRIGYCLDGIDPLDAVGEEEFTGRYFIRRTDSTTNFTIWEDIKIITKVKDNNAYRFKGEIYYDYTIKDGTFYKYGIQPEIIKTVGGEPRKERGILRAVTNPSIRDMNYSFLVGQHEQQLKLEFDNNITSYKINVTDSNNNTIGGVYPITRRVGNTNYKSFTVSGLISFNMDENFLFMPKVDIYNGYEEVQALYKQRELDQGKYNIAYEREFRENVLKFLSNGKVKLFKSASEGDLLVKLSDVSCSPNQQIGRLVYSFSATATEVAKYNIDNCLKYKITVLDEEGNRTNINLKEYPHSNVSPDTHEEV